jgi:ribosomal-protein-alanine N-acetyltransferase
MHPSLRHLARAAESLFGVLFPPDKERVEARWARQDAGNPLVTPRLLLYPITSDHLQAELAGGHGLGEISGFTVPEEWPPEQWEESAMRYLLDKMEPDGRPGWARYVALPTAGAPLLIGSCGTTSPITDETVEVEVGYSFLPAFHRRGYATEAVRSLLEWIFSHPKVERVSAQTLPSLSGSIRVLEKTGFRLVGSGVQPGTILYQLDRAGHQA